MGERSNYLDAFAAPTPPERAQEPRQAPGGKPGEALRQASARERPGLIGRTGESMRGFVNCPDRDVLRHSGARTPRRPIRRKSPPARADPASRSLDQLSPTDTG